MFIAPIAQYFIGSDLDNDPLPGDRDRNELSVRTLITQRGIAEHIDWVTLDPEVFFDFENSEERLTIDLEAGKMVSPTRGVFLRVGMGVGGYTDEDWSIKIGFRSLFPGVHLFK